MRAAVRTRQLTPGQEQRLSALRAVSRLLDSAFAIPGTTFKIGLDPIVGLVPWVGDLVSPAFTIAILWHARDLGLPRVVQLRMLINAAADTLIGMVPVAGDLFDFAWKSNNANFALLERHASDVRRPSIGDWLFVIVVIVLLVAIAALPIVLAGMLIRFVSQLF